MASTVVERGLALPLPVDYSQIACWRFVTLDIAFYLARLIVLINFRVSKTHGSSKGARQVTARVGHWVGAGDGSVTIDKMPCCMSGTELTHARQSELVFVFRF